MITRIYAEADFKLCVRLFMDVFNHEPWNDRWKYADAEQYLRECIASPGFQGVIACDDMDVCGFILGNRKKWWSGDEFFIQEMCVAPAAQRGGVGTGLLKCLQDHPGLDGIRRITLLTGRGIPAEDFYRKNGFREIEKMLFMSKKAREPI